MLLERRWLGDGGMGGSGAAPLAEGIRDARRMTVCFRSRPEPDVDPRDVIVGRGGTPWL